MTSRTPTVGGDLNTWGTVLNEYLSHQPHIDLVRDYGVSTSNSASTNGTAINQALSDSVPLGCIGVYLPPSLSRYPCSGVTLPSAPVRLFGANPLGSVLQGPSGMSTPMISAPSAGLPSSGNFGTDVQFNDSSRGEVSGIGIDCSVSPASGNKGFSSTTQSGGHPLAYHLRNVYIYGTWGTGIELINSGGVWGSLIEDCVVWNTTGAGIVCGSDMLISNCVIANVGLEGILCSGYGTSLQIDNTKVYSAGTNNSAGHQMGVYLNVNSGTLITNLYCQDNFEEGVVITAHNVVIDGLVCDNNSQRSAGAKAGLKLVDCHNVQIRGYHSTDRLNNGPSTHQTHGLLVVNTSGTTNYNNVVEMTQEPTDEGNGLPVMSSPVDPLSDLRGTEVRVGGSGGGQITLTPASGVIHPDPYRARTQLVPMTAHVTTVGTAYNMHPGCRMNLTFMSSGPGTFTVSGWDASYKGTVSIPATGGTTGQFLNCDFEATVPATGGTYWYLQNTPAWRP